MRYLLMIFLFLWMSGCAPKIPSYPDVTVHVEESRSAKEQALLKRFSEYWHYRLQRDLKKSYLYELPYQRYLIPYSEYKGLIDGYGKGAIVEMVAISYPSSNVAIVKRIVKTKHGTMHSKDKWVYVDGVWYHKFFQNILPPKNKEEEEFQ